MFTQKRGLQYCALTGLASANAASNARGVAEVVR